MTSRALSICFTAAALLIATAPAPAAPSSGGAAPPARKKAPPAEKTVVAPVVVTVINASFELGNLLNWQRELLTSDVVVLPKDPPDPCVQPGLPSDGNFMACMSTNHIYGGFANGGVRTDLTSGPITFDFKPGNIKVSFDVDFQTEESAMSIGHNDSFEARLVTAAGSFPIIQIDTFGPTEPGRGLKVVGFTEMLGTQPGCAIVGLRTGLLNVSWSKTVDPVMRTLVDRGPVFVEFTISNQGDATMPSIACIDNLVVKATKPE